MHTTTPSAALQIEQVTKRFGDTLANDDVSLTLGHGEVLALLGENGAGKTTLMNILFGHYTADSGTVSVDGRVLPSGKPQAAIAAGVGMVHQHFSLARNLSVMDNILTGTESLWRWRSNGSQARRKLAAISERFDLPVNPDALVRDLSVGEQQRVEILKALYNDARVLILDEPTAVLTNHEADRLFAILCQMAANGLSLIFISHKLNEVMSASDRVVVMRAGAVVAERETHSTDKAELAELMVGRRVTRPQRTPGKLGSLALQARSVSVKGRLHDVDFSVRAGEMLGIVGVAGNGQSALGELLCGVSRAHSGELELLGERFPQGDVGALVRRGVGRIPEDRGTAGVIGELRVWENAVLERAADPEFCRFGVIRQAAGRQYASRLISEFDVRGGGPDHRARLLSGGNIQKLILGRNLSQTPRVLIAAQPSRGLDEGAVAAVHTRLLEARAQGAAVLLISEDLDEVLLLADRIQAIVRGRLSAPIPSEQANATQLGLMMAGDWSSESLGSSESAKPSSTNASSSTQSTGDLGHAP